MSIPFDLTELLHHKLKQDKREPDGMLHCSSDLIGSLRHAQLKTVVPPTMESELMSDIRMNTGTLWHNYFDEIFLDEGLPVMLRVNLTPWLPKGWSGTADWAIWNPNQQVFVIGDLKTIKGEGMRFIKESGAKDEHLWQASAYHHAMVAAGFPMSDKVAVYYLPMNDVPDRNTDISPSLEECRPVPVEEIEDVMKNKALAVEEYLEEYQRTGEILNEALARPKKRVQQISWNGKMNVFDLKLTPHWTNRYCPFDLVYCDCSTQRPEKIGHYQLDGTYVPRTGYTIIKPTVEPSPVAYNTRRKSAS